MVLIWDQTLQKKKKTVERKKNKHSIENSQPSGILNKTQIPQMKTKEHKVLKRAKKRGASRKCVCDKYANFLRAHSVGL